MGKQKNKRTSSGFVMINENIETLVSFHFHPKYFLFIFSVKKVELIIGGMYWYQKRFSRLYDSHIMT